MAFAPDALLRRRRYPGDDYKGARCRQDRRRKGTRIRRRREVAEIASDCTENRRNRLLLWRQYGQTALWA
jgi:hypothetical protein